MFILHRNPWNTILRRTRVVAAAVIAIIVIPGARAVSAQDGGARFNAAVGVWNATRTLNETPTTLILYSEANFWGDQLRLQIASPTSAESFQVITKTQLEAVNLLGRVSSVRLRCGSRDSHVMLAIARNTSPNIAYWSPLASGYPITCLANTTTLVNLHLDAPQYADAVGSVYFVAHAQNVELVDLAGLLLSNWARETRSLDGAKADGGAQLRLTTPGRFNLRQDLKLNDWRCREHWATFELQVQVHMGGPPASQPNDYFNVIVGSTYVDTAWPDPFDCRSRMHRALKADAAKAARRLEVSLSQLAGTLLSGHSRYYFVPTYGLQNFWLAGGGAPEQQNQEFGGSTTER